MNKGLRFLKRVMLGAFCCLAMTNTAQAQCASGFTPPYSEDFSSFLPTCWEEGTGTLTTSSTLTTGSSDWYDTDWMNNSSSSNGFAATVNLYTTGLNDWLISPTINLGTSGNYQVEFDIAFVDYATSTGGSLGSDDTLVLVISTDNGATWQLANAIQTWTSANTGFTNQHVVFSLASYTGQIKLGFYASEGTVNDPDDIEAMIDNFQVNVIPACPVPTALIANNISPTTADLNWTENGTATLWQIEYGTTGFALGSGTKQMVSSKPYTLSSLSSNTTYDYYVRAVCGPNDTSAWSSSANTFTTLCAAFTPPYSEDFSTFIPSCWDEATGILTTSSTLTPGSTNWYDTDWMNNASSPNGFAATVNLYTTGLNDWLISPSIDLGTTIDYQVEFDIAFVDYATSTGGSLGSDDTLALVISTDNGATWQLANTIQTWTAANTGFTNQHVVFSLASYTGQIKLGFYASEGTVNDPEDVEAMIDNFQVKVIPACAVPTALTATNITTTSADLNWTENGTATLWQIEYGTTGFALGSGTKQMVSSKPYTLGSLSPNTTYDYYVRAVCGPNDTSAWSASVYTFTTPCVAFTPPYTEDFTAYVPGCWNEAKGALGTGTTLTGSSSGWTDDDWLNNSSNSQAAKINLYDLGKNDWLVSPTIDLGTGTSYQVEFDLAFLDYADGFNLPLGGDDTLAVVVSTNNGATWDLANALQIWTSANSTFASQHIILSLASYSGQIKIGFYGSEGVNNDAPDVDVMVDNFQVIATPACPVPSALTATVTSTSADLNWTENGTATLWQIEYGQGSFTQGSGTKQMVSSKPHTIGSLTATTQYSFFVRAVCGPNDTSAWSSRYTFSTLPANDDCANAITLTQSVTCTNTTGNTAGATQTMAASPCFGNPDDDVWYQFVATSTTANISISNVTGTSTDMYHQLLDGTCGSFTSLKCSDANNSTTSGLTIGNTYYIRAYTYYGGDNAQFDICVTSPPPPPANDDCANAVTLTQSVTCTNTTGNTAGATQTMAASPCNGNPDDDIWYSFVATSTTANIAISNASGTTTDMYHQLLDGTCGSLTSLKCSDANTSSTSGLTIGNTYYVRVYTYGSGQNAQFDICITSPPPPPVNDDAIGAIPVVVGAPCVGNTYTNAAATQSANEPYTSCRGTSGYSSVWYSFVAPASGSVKISNDFSGGTMGGDSRMALFSATNPADYNTFSIIACDDDGGVTQSARSIIYAANLTPGTIYYVQVDGYSSSTTQGTFCLEVSELTASMLAATNCGTAGQSPTVNNSYAGWINLLSTNGDLIAMVRNTGGGTSTTSYDVQQNINAGAVRQEAGTYYLDRNYLINSSVAGPVDVRFFFTDAELTALQTAAGSAPLANLNVTRQSGSSCQADYNPANGTESLLTQTTSGSGANYHWLQVQTPSFSNFYIHTGIQPLAIELTELSAKNEGNHNLVTWSTATEAKGDYFVVERSADGRNFTQIGTVTAKGQSSDYTYRDEQPYSGTTYYRLQLVNNNGKTDYTKTVEAVMTAKGTFIVEAYPNPVSNVLTVKTYGTTSESATVTISDITGKALRTVNMNGGKTEVDMNNLPAGVYMLQYHDNTHHQTIRINKQ